jgi:hypothetical protein
MQMEGGLHSDFLIYIFMQVHVSSGIWLPEAQEPNHGSIFSRTIGII